MGARQQAILGLAGVELFRKQNKKDLTVEPSLNTINWWKGDEDYRPIRSGLRRTGEVHLLYY